MNLFRISAAILMTSLLGCARAPVQTTVVDGEFLKIAGTPYRKLGAFKATILYVGYKKEHSFESVYLPITPKEIQARLMTEAFTDQTKKAALNAEASVGSTAAKLGGKFEETITEGSKGTYKIFVIQNIADLVDALNSDENRKRLQELKYYDEPRIIIGTAVVFNQESLLNKNNAGNINLSIAKFSTSPEIKFGGSRGIDSTVKLSDGTTFAYEFARMCFIEADNRIRVATLDPDRPARDTNCPAGTYKSLIALEAAQNTERALANKSQ